MATSRFFGLITLCRIDPFDFRLSIYISSCSLLTSKVSCLRADVTIDLTVGNILHNLFFLNYDYDDMVVAYAFPLLYILQG